MVTRIGTIRDNRLYQIIFSTASLMDKSGELEHVALAYLGKGSNFSGLPAAKTAPTRPTKEFKTAARWDISLTDLAAIHFMPIDTAERLTKFAAEDEDNLNTLREAQDLIEENPKNLQRFRGLKSMGSYYETVLQDIREAVKAFDGAIDAGKLKEEPLSELAFEMK